MKIEVIATNEVYDTLHKLMKFNKELVDGNEISAWLTGDKSLDKETGVVTFKLDSVLIPEQEVSGAMVDVTPEQMVNLANIYGLDVTNRIIGQWHIHPFAGEDTNWSGTDADSMNEFMNPVTGRDAFVFLLSNFKKLKASAYFNFESECKSLDYKQVIRQRYDDVVVTREEQLEEEDISGLEEIIKERVKIKTYKWKNDRTGDKTVESSVSDRWDMYTVSKISPSQVDIWLDTTLLEYIRMHYPDSPILKHTSDFSGKAAWHCLEFLKLKKGMADKLLNSLNEEMTKLTDEFEERAYKDFWEDTGEKITYD